MLLKKYIKFKEGKKSPFSFPEVGCHSQAGRLHAECRMQAEVQQQGLGAAAAFGTFT